MKVVPLDDRVLVKRQAENEKRQGTIIIPDTAKEKPQIGLVVAVGNDEELRELIKDGDKVLFAKYAGSEFEIDGTEHLVLQRSDILAKVK